MVGIIFEKWRARKRFLNYGEFEIFKFISGFGDRIEDKR
jgi:hypothetical protein